MKLTMDRTLSPKTKDAVLHHISILWGHEVDLEETGA